MRRALWSVAAAFAIVLQVAAEIPVQPDFDIKKTAGKWHDVALVIDKGEMKTVTIHQTTVVLKDGGDAIITKEVSDGKACNKEEFHLLHTDQPGKYTTPNGSTVHVVEIDYDSYLLLHVQLRGPVRVLYLSTRKPEASDDLKEKFKKVANSLGFSDNKITYLTKPDPCWAPTDAKT